MTTIARKWVLITGAASGIGHEAALAFAREGANIVATDLDRNALHRIRSDIEIFGSGVIVEPLDVTCRGDFERVLASLDERDIEIDILLNNAGIGWLGGVEEHSEQTWRKIVEVNLMGVVFGTQAMLPRFRAAGTEKHIVNVASLAAVAPACNMSAYATSKYAVMGFTDCLGIECQGSRIKVTCVHPGVINTPILENIAHSDSISTGQLEKLRAHYLGSGSNPSDVARDIVKAVRNDRCRLFSGSQSTTAGMLKRLLPTRLMWRLCRRTSIRAGYACVNESRRMDSRPVPE